jgi:hypothetical protein
MHKSEVAQDLKNVFDVGLQSDTKQLAMLRLSEFIIKWSKYYRYIEELKNKKDMEMYFTFKDFRRTIKIRNELPNEQAALFLLTKVAMDKNVAFPVILQIV